MYVQELYADYSENKKYFAKTNQEKKNEWWCTAFIAEHGYTPHRALTRTYQKQVKPGVQSRKLVLSECLHPSHRRDSRKSQVMTIVMAQRHYR